MPTAPTYQDTDPGVGTVSPTLITTAHIASDAPLAAFGGGEKVQEGADRLTETSASISGQWKERADKLASIVMSKKLSELETDTQYNKEYGVMNLRGADAVKAPDKAQELWKKGTDDISKTVSNPAQQMYFNEMSEQHWQNLNSNLQHHVSSEMLKYSQDQADAANTSEINAAGLAASSNDPERVALAMGNITSTIIKKNQIMGIPADSPVTKSDIAEGISKLHVGVVQSLLANEKTKEAEIYFDKNKGSIYPANVRNALEDKVRQESLYNIMQDVSSFADKHRLDDGLIDIEAAHEYVKSLKLPAREQYQAESHIRSIVYVDNAETKEIQNDKMKSAIEQMMADEKKGVPLVEAQHRASQFAYNNESAQKIQDMGLSIYSSPEEKFKAWLDHSPQAVQGAVAEMENIVKTKYGKNPIIIGGVPQDQATVALTELKEKVLGKTPDQIRQITTDAMKSVPTTKWAPLGFRLPDFIQRHQPQFAVDANDAQLESAKWSQMRKDFGSANVDAAMTKIALDTKNKSMITPENVKGVLDDAVKKNAKPK